MTSTKEDGDTRGQGDMRMADWRREDQLTSLVKVGDSEDPRTALSEWRGGKSSENSGRVEGRDDFLVSGLATGLLTLLIKGTVFCSAWHNLAQIPLREQKVRPFPVEFLKSSFP